MVRKLLVSLSALLLLLSAGLTLPASAQDLTTRYRLYSYDRIIGEYQNYWKALSEAKALPYAHIETIADRQWKWDNYPRYQVYSDGKPVANGAFDSLNAAIAKAQGYDFASVRDTQGVGWVWDNYPKYEVFQGENTKSGWTFDSLQAAEHEAKKWAHSHVIDLSTNQWVWDNASADYIAAQRKQDPVYTVYLGTETKEGWAFGYLGDAVKLAESMDGAIVMNMGSYQQVYANTARYSVVDAGGNAAPFTDLDAALAKAKPLWHSKILMNGQEIWSNYKYYEVTTNTGGTVDFSALSNAVSYASGIRSATLSTEDGRTLWDSQPPLQYWAWNGESTPDQIQSQVQDTQGLDVDSPTWFLLGDASGTIKDTSDAGTVRWLHEQGIKVVPLVSNNFDGTATHAFLSSSSDEAAFIHNLMVKCLALGVDGINLDFESMYGSDRAAYTAFFRMLTASAHLHQLQVSIDVPRGDPLWDAKTAYDQPQLSQIADYVVLMAYDEYWSGSDSAGSVSGLPWTDQGVADFLTYGIPRNKLILGAPFYSRLWKLDANGNLVGNQALLMKDIPALIAAKHAASIWDPTYDQYKETYTENGYTYEFWLEDANTLQKRVDIAAKYDLAGVSFWKLGHESAGIWPDLIAKK